MGLASAELSAQPTEFTYQGSLNDNGAPADGSYDFEFALFDAPAAGSQVGTTQTRSNVVVADGIFTVELDFGSQFPGADRFIEIRVRAAGGGGFTTLAPRQQIASAPYAVNARNLGGVAANQYVLTGDARLSDARNPLPGSSHYIQNSTGLQGSGNFNISGTGQAGVFDAAESFHIGGHRILHSPDTQRNLFVGRGAGNSLSTGNWNSFFGYTAGNNTGIGVTNSFFGAQAGFSNTEGSLNSFFGAFAGAEFNLSGSSNSFFGAYTGEGNLSGSNITLLGAAANVGLNPLNYATAVGAGSVVPTSNTIALGRADGSDQVFIPGKVGIGTNSSNQPLHIAVNNSHIAAGSFGCSSGFVGIALGNANPNCLTYSLLGDGTDTMLNAPADGMILFRIGNLTRATINASGILGLPNLGAAGSTSLCRNASNQVSTCSSSIRYKSNIANFSTGLDLIKRLRPVSFMWKDGGSPDFGLVAEEVAGIEPLLTTLNPDGRTEGVKYDRLGVVLVNAVKEQQQLIESKQIEIDRQNDLIRRQQAEIDRLQARQIAFEAEIRALVCPKNDTVHAGGLCNG